MKFEKTVVFNFEGAIRGMRNPLESWSKSDTEFSMSVDGQDIITIGPNDLQLMQTLIRAGSVHRKFMRQIFVSVDITASLYWWKEFDTYKVGTVANSRSTMHKIHARPFEIDDFSHENLTDSAMHTLYQIMWELNAYRGLFIDTKKKEYWWNMIQLLPSSYNQLRTVQLNYQVLKSMYHARKAHKLDEWHTFCDWVETLPYSELITNK